MEKIHGNSSKYLLYLSLSLIISFFFFFFNLYWRGDYELSWSRKAARDAEVAASVLCSGHGHAFLDGLLDQQESHVCECRACFVGPNCSEFNPDCPADLDSGDPLYLEPFWMKHEAPSAVMVAGWHRMSYVMSSGSLISVELERHIRKLHSVVGNANATSRFIVFGVGSMQLIGAAIYALSSASDLASPMNVVASVPYYTAYKDQTELFSGRRFEWKGDASEWDNTSSSNLIEFVTSPNNPDGELKESVFESSPKVKTIHDHAYYWPHYTGIPSPANEDLMLFSISKITGHAGSRFGGFLSYFTGLPLGLRVGGLRWALVKDEEVYKKMMVYVQTTTIGVSHETQLRALSLLKVVLEGRGGREIFEFGYERMRARWIKLNAAFMPSKRFSLQNLSPRYCTYFRDVTGPSPAYAWLKCEMEEDNDCYEVLKTAGVIGRPGSFFGAQSRYVRLSLLKSEDYFELLLRRIEVLVAKEAKVINNI